MPAEVPSAGCESAYAGWGVGALLFDFRRFRLLADSV
jgi:hypothetical protein